MNTQTQEALKIAIEALSQDEGWFEPEAAIKACKEALEQPARLVSYAPDKSTCTLNIDGEEVYFNREQPSQEPVLLNVKTHDNNTYKVEVFAPSWQGLSDDEIEEIIVGKNGTYFNFARAIEQALKEKNT